MAGRLAGRRVVFVGGATGIGRETVARFVDEGAAVVVADVNAEAGGEAAGALGVGFVACDITDEASVAAMIVQADRTLGGIDVLVNNAGLQYSGHVTDFDGERWDRIFAVNAKGPFLACKHAVPRMRAAGRKGSIINTASLAGFRGGAGMTAYSATKGAVIAFTTALALELAPDGIRVNAVCPGWVDTPFNRPAIDFMGGVDAQAKLLSSAVPLGRQAAPAEIAPLFVYLASEESSFMTAQSIVIDGGVYN